MNKTNNNDNNTNTQTILLNDSSTVTTVADQQNELVLQAFFGGSSESSVQQSILEGSNRNTFIASQNFVRELSGFHEIASMKRVQDEGKKNYGLPYGLLSFAGIPTFGKNDRMDSPQTMFFNNGNLKDGYNRDALKSLTNFYTNFKTMHLGVALTDTVLDQTAASQHKNPDAVRVLKQMGIVQRAVYAPVDLVRVQLNNGLIVTLHNIMCSETVNDFLKASRLPIVGFFNMYVDNFKDQVRVKSQNAVVNKIKSSIHLLGSVGFSGFENGYTLSTTPIAVQHFQPAEEEVAEGEQETIEFTPPRGDIPISLRRRLEFDINTSGYEQPMVRQRLDLQYNDYRGSSSSSSSSSSSA